MEIVNGQKLYSSGEVYNALRVIRDICTVNSANDGCIKCPLRIGNEPNMRGNCMIIFTSPKYWVLKTDELDNRLFREVNYDD